MFFLAYNSTLKKSFSQTINSKSKLEKKDSSRKKLIFPRDHGSHLDYGIEWWYVTGWLKEKNSKQIAYQLTFFRSKTSLGYENKSRFSPEHLIFAHATLISKDYGGMESAQKAGRLGPGLVRCSIEDTNVFFEDWFINRDLFSDSYDLNAEGKEFSYRLKLKPRLDSKNLILRGKNGLSRKGPKEDQTSWYYSRPNLETNGVVILKDKKFDVSGLSWLDHEWSSELLHPDAVGWDWIGINLIDGGSLMAFRIRKSDGSTLWHDFSMLNKDGEVHLAVQRDKSFSVQLLPERDISPKWLVLKEWTSPHSFAKYPVSQKITFGFNELEVYPLILDQEVDARMSTGGFYWEGGVILKLNNKFFGKGFLELTGYESPLRIG